MLYICLKINPYYVKWLYNVNFFDFNPEKILIMEKAKFYHSSETLRTLKDLDISNLFSSVFTKTHPITEFFAMIKSRFCAIRNWII
jgi:hypothetical protein